MQKIKSKAVSSLDEYIEKVCRDNNKLLSYTSEHYGFLKIVEK